MIRSVCHGLLFTICLLTSTSVLATQEDHRVVVSPGVRVLELLKDDPPPFIRKGVVSKNGFRGTVRFNSPLTRREIAQLEAAGIRFSRRSRLADPVDRIGAIYPAFIPFALIPDLQRFSRTVQIDPVLIEAPEPALDITNPLCTADRAAAMVPPELGVLPGEGIRIVDIDAGMDVFHPSFFRPGQQLVAWLDHDGNGELTLGVDCADLNGDEVCQGHETLRLIDAGFVDYDDEDTLDVLGGDGQFQPDRDWLYADTNGSGRREYGPAYGYNDESPGFGEPLFVMDDVNRDGQGQPAEKLFMLTTSKVEAVWAEGQEYRRGENLTQVDPFMFGHEDWIPRSKHGTAVTGILAGNTPGLNQGYGMAPYATLYVADFALDSFYESGEVDTDLQKLVWAQEQEAHVVLFEFGSWTATFMDGSTNLESAMDEIFSQGIMVVAAAGNLGGKGKHMFHDFDPGQTDVGMTAPYKWGTKKEKKLDMESLSLALHWEGEKGEIDLALLIPGMEQPVPIPEDTDQPILLMDRFMVVSFAEESARGFVYRSLYVWDDLWDALPLGKYNWVLTNHREEPLPVHGFVKDNESSWSKSVMFDDWKTSYYTLAHPAMADSALTVGAYCGRACSDKYLGKMKYYSSRGPRIDGAQGIEIVAPADPFAPSPHILPGVLVDGVEMFGGYREFSGTSGAAPHVAGSVALLRQLYPEESTQQLFDRVTQGARAERQMGELPHRRWGYGKMDAYRAAFGVAPPENDPPKAALELLWRKGLTAQMDASASSDDMEQPLEYRWDFEYDGLYDTPWGTDPTLELSPAQPGMATVKVQVRDLHGARDAALLAVEFSDDWVEPAPEPAVEAELDLVAQVADQRSDLWTAEAVVDIEQADGAQTGSAATQAGCGCRLHSSPSLSPAPLLMLLILLLATVRTRREFACRTPNPVVKTFP